MRCVPGLTARFRISSPYGDTLKQASTSPPLGGILRHRMLPATMWAQAIEYGCCLCLCGNGREFKYIMIPIGKDFCCLYDITDDGNFERKSIPNRIRSQESDWVSLP